eukprot:gene10849-22643_t
MEEYNYYEDPFNGEGSYGASDEVINEGSWGVKNRMQEDLEVITSMSYDVQHELLWVGNSAGRVTSYMIKDKMQRYSSFFISHTTVPSILTTDKSVISITERNIRMHSIGGLGIATYHAPIPSGDINDAPLLTSGILMRPSGALATSSNDGPTHIIVGTSASPAYCYDMLSTESPVVEYDMGASTTCCSSSGLYIAMGGGDGKIRLLDGRLRMKKVSHVLDAHTGIVNDVAVQVDDVTLVSCGMSGRAINPYDPTSPITYSSDHIVRVFDLRMLRPLSPIPLPMANTTHVRFIPSHPNALMLFASPDGLIQTYNPTGESPTATDIFYAPLTTDNIPDPSVQLSAVAVSSSGQLISVGSTSGCVTQFGLVTLPHDKEPVANARSALVRLPSPVVAPAVSLTIDSQILATAYIVKPKKYVDGHQ